MTATAYWGRWENRSKALRHHPANQNGAMVITEAWVNSVFSVQLSVETSAWGDITHLWVKRHDGKATVWADMQRIKNEIVGPEVVGMEMYPAQSDVVDQAPMYHIWCLPPDLEFPFGLHRR